MRFAFGFLLLAHGIAHLVGFAAAWRLGNLPDLPHKTTLLAGAVDIGEAGTRAVGVLWLALAVGFAAAALGVALRQPWWPAATWWAIAVSSLLCLLHWPEARVGLAPNAFLVVALYASGRFGFLRLA